MSRFLNFLSILLYFSFFLLHAQNTDYRAHKPVTLGFMGDVMLGRLVDVVIAHKGYRYPWGNMRDLLHKNTINIINLETTLTRSTQKVPKVFNFKARPEAACVLQEGAVTVANVANNHILDFGITGMQDTLGALKKAGIYSMGAGITQAAAQRPVIIEKNGIKFGFLGFTDNEPTWAAGSHKPGINYVKVGDIQTIQEQVKKLRPYVDYIILSIHWGPNMRQRPTQEFIDFAHKIIDAGVDIIHGHSAHVFQAVEIYKNRVIFYDTGDFIDDYAVDSKLRNDQSFLFTVTLDKNTSKKVNLIPVIISNMQVNRATGTQAHEILQKMRDLSAEHATQVTPESI